MYLIYFVLLSSASAWVFPDLESRCNESYCHIIGRNMKYSGKKAYRLWEFHMDSCYGLEVLELMPNLRSLELEFCFSENFTMKNLIPVRHLSNLQLRRGNLSELHAEDFANWPQMKVLELGGNSITGVANGSFKGLSQLWFLSLPGNDIQDLPEGVFQTLPELLHLDLSGNYIGKLRENIFDGNQKLEMLLLNGNPLTWIAPTALGSLRNLRLLDLTNCGPLPDLKVPGAQSMILDNMGLKYLDIKGSVSKLQARNNKLTNIRLADKSSVTELDLQNNSLTTYDIPGLLMGMWRLQRLDLSRNLIHKYPAAGSDNSSELFLLPNLMFVNLSANFLQRLHYDSPFPWTRLTHLDLSYNRIYSLPASAIDDAFNLQSLHIEGNYLSYFSTNTFKKPHPALKEVALYDNKFKPGVYENITKFFRDIKVNVLEKTQHDLPNNENLKESCGHLIEKTQDDHPKNEQSIGNNEPVNQSNESLKKASGNFINNNDSLRDATEQSQNNPARNDCLNEACFNSTQKSLSLPPKKDLEVRPVEGFIETDNNRNWSMWNILMPFLLIASLALNAILIVQHYRIRGRHLIPQDSPPSSLETTFISDFRPDDPILH